MIGTPEGLDLVEPFGDSNRETFDVELFVKL